MQRGRADSGDLEIDLTELFADAASVAADLGVGIALFVDEMQDIPTADVSALCAACHELSQTGGAADRGRARACRTCRRAVGEQELLRAAVPVRRIDRLDREAADLALIAPAQREGVDFTAGGARRAVRGRGRLSLLRPGLRQGDLGRGRGQPGDRGRRAAWPPPRPRASWPSGSSAAGTSGPPRPSASTCGRWPRLGDDPVPTSEVADELGPQAVQPVTGPGRADQEGADLQLRARPDRVHRAAFRQVPALPARLAGSPSSRRRSIRLSGCLARCLESPRERQTRGSRWGPGPRRCPRRERPRGRRGGVAAGRRRRRC